MRRQNRSRKFESSTEEEKEVIRQKDRDRNPQKTIARNEREAVDPKLREARLVKHRVKDQRRQLKRGVRELQPYSVLTEPMEVDEDGDVYVQLYSRDSGAFSTLTPSGPT